jgi:hypothetical protein
VFAQLVYSLQILIQKIRVPWRLMTKKLKKKIIKTDTAQHRACRKTADGYGLSSFVILIIFCNLAEVNKSSAKPTNGSLTHPYCGKPGRCAPVHGPQTN